MLAEIQLDVARNADLTGRSRLSPRVLDALRKVPRHAYVPEEIKEYAYVNRAQPIGFGQTISQPYIVALMTDLIDPKADDVVLEIGTGSGYQAAVLASLVARVYTLEIVPELAERARQRLQRMGYSNVEIDVRNGHLGWPEHAPYDAIVVTAAASRIDEALLGQLKPGGTLIIPVGEADVGQQLQLVKKDSGGQLECASILPVIFVPFVQSEPASEGRIPH